MITLTTGNSLPPVLVDDVASLTGHLALLSFGDLHPAMLLAQLRQLLVERLIPCESLSADSCRSNCVGHQLPGHHLVGREIQVGGSDGRLWPNPDALVG